MLELLSQELIGFESFKFCKLKIQKCNSFSKDSLSFFFSLSETENSIYLRLYRPYGTHSHHDTRASRSIFCVHFCNFLINYMIIDKFIFFQISQKGKTIVDFI